MTWGEPPAGEIKEIPPLPKEIDNLLLSLDAAFLLDEIFQERFGLEEEMEPITALLDALRELSEVAEEQGLIDRFEILETQLLDSAGRRVTIVSVTNDIPDEVEVGELYFMVTEDGSGNKITTFFTPVPVESR